MTSATTSQAEKKTGETPKPIFRKDYKPPHYLIKQVFLEFVLDEDFTIVRSRLHVVPNYNPDSPPPPLELNGEAVELQSVKISDQECPKEQYTVDTKFMRIKDLKPGDFVLEITTKIKPQENTLLQGLYKTKGTFCTQCEAEGFRRITYFIDRPDVMSKYNVRIEGNKEKYPVLLSNGNLTESGDLDDGRHFAIWDDPFPKPCYLFALVAGALAKHTDTFTTMSGRQVQLCIHAQHHNIHKVEFAMQALKQAMKWDEERFGLEYDLQLFNVVAIDDFNMGAMENKSLNIFNSRFVLASTDTATDTDFLNVQVVIGHEYFHNWTGNRVTCRDWFQLTLKEGLTVFREREFTSDMNSHAVKRIEDVRLLRSTQFPEDRGPLAHPIRPESYIKMDNFYTSTVYHKGAEVIRLYQTVLGRDGFRKGMDLYFQRHDGHAVTCDDFLAAMADANNKDLTSLGKWYLQAGTPQLTVTPSYSEVDKTFTLRLKQLTPATPGQDVKESMLIPVSVGLLGPDGQDLPLKLQGKSEEQGMTVVLEFDKAEDTFVFTDVPSPPVPSILRDFSAPVKTTVEGQTEDDLLFLFANDCDSFNKWEAGQRLIKNVIMTLYEAGKKCEAGSDIVGILQSAGGIPDKLVRAFRLVLKDSRIDSQCAALATTLPTESELVEDIPEADPVLLHKVCVFTESELARCLRGDLEEVVALNDEQPGEPYIIDGTHAGRRRIKNHALHFLGALNDPSINAECLRRFREASNMTDAVGILSALNSVVCPEREAVMAEFYEKWKADPIVTLKWLTYTARSDIPGNVETMRKMVDHPAFDMANPNCNYSLFRAFATSAVNFHAEDGSGYEYLADAIIRLDKINHQVAAIVANVFTTWRRYDKVRQQLMKSHLKRIKETEGLSENVMEVASKSLDD